jgi:hypothetical protein
MRWMYSLASFTLPGRTCINLVSIDDSHGKTVWHARLLLVRKASHQIVRIVDRRKRLFRTLCQTTAILQRNQDPFRLVAGQAMSESMYIFPLQVFTETPH